MTTPPAELPRFGRASRWVHAATAVLVLGCVLTGAVLYLSPLAVAVGHRPVVELVHVTCGLALPGPALAGLVSGRFRGDLRWLDRFTAADLRWLRSRTRRDGTLPVGKFNAGQKLNAALSAGGVGVLLLTGAVMQWPDAVPVAWRTGATFVHDWTALALGLLVLGHLRFALLDPVAMRSLRTGTVPVGWARREHGAWADELLGERADR